jgi:hypothetical protein
LAVGGAKSGRQDAALYGRLEACRHRRVTPEMSASARYFKLLQIKMVKQAFCRSVLGFVFNWTGWMLISSWPDTFAGSHL